MQRNSERTHLFGTAFVILALGAAPLAAAQDDPKDIVATQLRAQGHACDNPKSAARDPEASKPNKTVWVLTCENATYRATLIPNMAAQVQRLDEDE